MKPYYDDGKGGILRHENTNDVRLWVRKLGADRAEVYIRPQPANPNPDGEAPSRYIGRIAPVVGRRSRGAQRTALASGVDEANAPAGRGNLQGLNWLHPRQGHIGQGEMGRPAQARHGSRDWPQTRSARNRASHQRRPCGQQTGEPVSLSRPRAPQRRSPLAGCRASHIARGWSRRLSGRCL